MRFGFILLLGLVFAAGLGLAAHLIARDTVALPVASIQAGERLAPVTTRPAARPRRMRTMTLAPRRPRPPPRPRPTTITAGGEVEAETAAGTATTTTAAGSGADDD